MLFLCQVTPRHYEAELAISISVSLISPSGMHHALCCDDKLNVDHHLELVLTNNGFHLTFLFFGTRKMGINDIPRLSFQRQYI